MSAAADALLAAHFAFVVFVLGGGMLALRWPRIAWLHLPCAAWGALVEFADLPCPLTAWEHALRGVDSDLGFVARLLAPILYPDLAWPGVLSPPVRVALGSIVLALNAAVYAWVFKTRRRRASPRP